MDDERYHLSLTLDGRPAMTGWWSREKTARDQFKVWVGERGSLPGVRIVLVDELEARVLASWPDEADRLRD